MIAFLLIIIYIGLFSLWLRKSSYFTIEGLPKPLILFIFLIKIASGILYGHIHNDYFHGGDTVAYIEESRRIYETFADYPQYYLYSILGMAPPPIPADAGVFTYPESAIFWKDLGTYVLVHLHAVLHIFTGGYYNVHIVFIALLGLLAGINYYRVFRSQFDIPNRFLIAACFFLPSLLFWTSGLHKDIFVYWGLSLVFSFAINPRELRISGLVLGLIVVGLFRHYLLLLLLPAVLAYYWSLSAPQRAWSRFAMLYGGAFLLVVILQVSGLPILNVLVNKQADFLAEIGGSKIPSLPLEPSFYGFFSALPRAFFNVSIRPLIWESRDFWQALAALEILGFWLLVCLGLFFFKRDRLQHPLVAFLTYYALSNWLLIGVLVSNMGTLVRYRAIALGMLVLVVLQGLDYARLLYKKKTTLPLPLGTIEPTENPGVPLEKMRA